RNAAQIWGFQEPQAESSFDPLVSLLLGACAFELEKISGEINNSESRIIERMVNIMTPHPITSPHPAYAVTYAKPFRKGAKVKPGDQFYSNIKVSDRFQKNAGDKMIFFSPTGTFGLTDGRVRYIAAQKKIYEIVDDQYKDIITEKFKKPIPPVSLFVGMEMNARPPELTLFFDVISEHLKQSFFAEIESCAWKIGGISISSKKGLKDMGRREHDVYQLINRQQDLTSKISEHVNNYFNRQFITLNLKDIEDLPETDIMKIPAAIAGSVDEKELANIDKNIMWVELQFAKPVSDELLENIIISLNCFPVINLRQNEFTGSTRELVNIIPLHTEDVFFDLKCVTNSNGEAYKINHFISQNEISKGSALLRSDGVGRFDVRSAMEYLEYLLELMKEESAAFNVIGSNMIESNLRELNQAIARLEKKIEDVQFEKGDTAYLMLKPQDGDRQVFVEFWSTNCTQANNIRAGSMMNVYRADDIDYNASRLMTTTTGGKEKPNTEARINTFRRSLQSGNRVVTAEDIKALCFEYYGDPVDDVQIEKGIEKETGKSEGFIRTIDIFLIMKKGHDPDLEEQSRIRQAILVLLEERSSN
ncbi:MAG: hypothetical protein WCE64_08780, partial [Bacteroidales bacterium]